MSEQFSPWATLRDGPKFYLYRACLNPAKHQDSYQDFENESGDRVLFDTLDAAKAEADRLNAAGL